MLQNVGIVHPQPSWTALSQNAMALIFHALESVAALGGYIINAAVPKKPIGNVERPSKREWFRTVMNQKKQELKSNLLADRVEEFFIGLKPYIKWIVAAVVVLIAVGIAFGLRQQAAERVAAESWSDLYFAAGRPDQLDAIYQTYPGTQGALWARQTESDSLMGRALNSVYLDRNLSDELFSQASKGYQEILDQSNDSLIRSRATLGLAQALDGQGKSAEALAQYKRLMTIKGIHEGLKEDIQRRIEFIESEEGKTFFAWYKENRPSAPKPVDIPSNLNQLPGMPDLQFTTPKPPADSTPASTGTEDTTKPSTSGTSEPTSTSENAKSETEKPAFATPDMPAASTGDSKAASPSTPAEKPNFETPQTLPEAKPTDVKPALDAPAAEAPKTTPETPATPSSPAPESGS